MCLTLRRLLPQSIDLDEVDGTPTEVIANKATMAGEGVLVEDTCLDVDGSGFAGLFFFQPLPIDGRALVLMPRHCANVFELTASGFLWLELRNQHPLDA